MNIGEFANALAEQLMQAQATKAAELVDDIDEIMTAKARGHWHGLAEARLLLKDLALQLTEAPKPPPEDPTEPQEESFY